MGDGLGPLVSVDKLTFSNIFTVDAPLRVSDTTSSSGIGSGGSLTILGGGAISGKLFVGQDLNVSGNITVGNITINGSSSFNSVNSQNMTTGNLISTNITTNNLSTLTLNGSSMVFNFATISNCVLSNINTTNITSSTLRVSSTAYFNTAFSANISNTNASTINFTSNNMMYINATGTSMIITNSSINSLIANDSKLVSIMSTSINNTQSLTSGSIFVRDNAILNITTTGSLVSLNNTLGNIVSNNGNITNITNNNLNSINGVITNISSSNINSSNINTNNQLTNNQTSTNLIVSNITSSNQISTNNSVVNLNVSHITSGQLKVSGNSILGALNTTNISTGNVYSPNMIVTNNTCQNIISTNITTTNVTTTNILSSNISSNNLNISNISNLGTVNSLNLSTSNLSVATLTNLNDLISINISASSLRVSGISILGTVNSSNISTSNIFISNTLTVPFLSNTSITSTNTLTNNLKSISFTTSSLNVTGISIMGTVTSNNLSTGNIHVSNLTSLNNIISINSSTNTLSSESLTTGNLLIKTIANVKQQIILGSSYSGNANPTSGSHLTILPSIYTDNVSPASSTVSIWTPTFISTPTLAAQNLNISTQRASTIYIQGNPIGGANQTITNSSALSIGYVGNSTGGNLNGQILLERSDGNWFGSIYTEQSTNRIVIANGSLAGGAGIGLYSGVGTPIVFSNIASSNNVTPIQFIKFTNSITNFYSTQDSDSKTNGSLVLAGGLGVSKNISCDTITPTNINASIRSLNDVNKTTSLTNGQVLAWNGSQWNPTIISGGSGSGPIKIDIYPMDLVLPIMNSNGPVAGTDGDYFISASSEYNSTYAAYKCASSIKTPSDWATLTETTNFWIQVQLPSSQNVRYVYLDGRLNNEDPIEIIVQGSNDGVDFTDIISTQAFTALNFNGCFSARIPENSKDYTFYKFLFPSGAGVSPGLNMLRLFKYDTTTFTESIMDNSSSEANGKFDGCINVGKWPMAFNLNNSGTITIRAQLSCYQSLTYTLKKFIMYIDGSPFDYTASAFVKQFIYQNVHTYIQTIEWTGILSSGVHTLSFFAESGGILFDQFDTVKVNVLQY